MTIDKNLDEYNDLIKEQNEILLAIHKEETFEKFYGSLEEKEPYEAEKSVPKCDNYDFNRYNNIALRKQAELIAEIADKMAELKYFSNRSKKQYDYFKNLKETSDNLNPKIFKFIEYYEEFYARENKGIVE